MNLYEISNDLRNVIEGGMIVDEETGVILFDGDNLDELESAFNDKLEGCGLYIKNELAEIEAMKAEEKRLAERRRIKERKVERLKEYMLQGMERTGTSKLDTARVSISTRKSKRVVIDNDRDIPIPFLVTEVKPDKAKIKKALADREVPGAHIEESRNLILK